MEPVNVILNIIILVAVGAVGLLVTSTLRDVKELKALLVKVAGLEVKVETLWEERTDSNLSTPYPIRRRRSSDRDPFNEDD